MIAINPSPTSLERFVVKRSGIKMDIRPRCEMGCGQNGKGQVLGIRLTRPWIVQCRKCKHVNRKDLTTPPI